MILEALEWCATPASWEARRSGLLAAQIAIRHRKRRCGMFWRPHLEASRRFVEQCVGEDAGGSRGLAVVLGSGHLNDIDTGFLSRVFGRVILIDAVHPLEVRLRCLASRGRWRCVDADLADPGPEIDESVRGASWVFSTCLLSQLLLGRSSHSAAEIAGRHVGLLQRARRSALITDTARRFAPSEEWEGLLGGFALPESSASWVWQLAPPEEHGDPAKGMEERRVEACLPGT